MNDPTYNTINNKDWIIPHSHQIKSNIQIIQWCRENTLLVFPMFHSSGNFQAISGVHEKRRPIMVLVDLFIKYTYLFLIHQSLVYPVNCKQTSVREQIQVGTRYRSLGRICDCIFLVEPLLYVQVIISLYTGKCVSISLHTKLETFTNLNSNEFK